MAATGKKKHYCPPIPASFSVKFTGPAWEPGEPVAKARMKWSRYLRDVKKLTPMPSQAGQGGAPKGLS